MTEDEAKDMAERVARQLHLEAYKKRNGVDWEKTCYWMVIILTMAGFWFAIAFFLYEEVIK